MHSSPMPARSCNRTPDFEAVHIALHASAAPGAITHAMNRRPPEAAVPVKRYGCSIQQRDGLASDPSQVRDVRVRVAKTWQQLYEKPGEVTTCEALLEGSVQLSSLAAQDLRDKSVDQLCKFNLQIPSVRLFALSFHEGKRSEVLHHVCPRWRYLISSARL